MRLPICAALLLALCLGCARQQPPQKPPPMTEADVRALLAIWQGLQPKAPEPPKAPMQKAPMPQPCYNIQSSWSSHSPFYRRNGNR